MSFLSVCKVLIVMHAWCCRRSVCTNNANLSRSDLPFRGNPTYLGRKWALNHELTSNNYSMVFWAWTVALYEYDQMIRRTMKSMTRLSGEQVITECVPSTKTFPDPTHTGSTLLAHVQLQGNYVLHRSRMIRSSISCGDWFDPMPESISTSVNHVKVQSFPFCQIDSPPEIRF